MRSTRRLAALTIVAVLVISAVGAPHAAADPSTDLAFRLDRAIEARVAQMGIPGAIVSLSVPGEIDYVKAVGVGDTATGVPMMPDYHTRIGSVTKTFTGTAVLQLVDRGLIRLSDPISRYVDGVPSGDVITLDLLGRMRSGLPDYTEADTFLDRLYRESPSGPEAFATTPRELVEAAFTQPLDFEPDAKCEYSNTNTVLLGMVVEKVAGISLGDYLQQNIFGPLGLTQTSYPANGWLPGPYAHGYNRAPDGTVYDATLWNPSWAGAAGKIVSTVADQRVSGGGAGQGLAAASPDPGAADGRRFVRRRWRGLRVRHFRRPRLARPQRRHPRVHDGDGVSAGADATLVVVTNSDIPESHAAGQIAFDVTSIATPDHVYALGPEPPQLLEN